MQEAQDSSCAKLRASRLAVCWLQRYINGRQYGPFSGKRLMGLVKSFLEAVRPLYATLQDVSCVGSLSIRVAKKLAGEETL